MFVGGCVSAAPGDTTDMIRGFATDTMSGNVLRSKVDTWGYYRDRYFAVFSNGVYTGQNYLAPIDSDLTIPLNLGAGTTIGSIYLEDAGDWSSFNTDYYPKGNVEYFDSLTAQRLQLTWTASYTLSTVRGDTQLSSISITGAKRFRNCAAVPERSTRGRVSYSITTVSGTHIVRFWSGDFLVAEGSLSGNGAITCSPSNYSGMTVTGTLTYTGDVAPNTAFIDIRWPASYQIHYSKSSLSYPRTPEATAKDSGTDAYLYLSAVLSGGTWNWNVLQVDDDGDVQTTGIPTTTAQTINAPPASPTNLRITGSGALVTNLILRSQDLNTAPWTVNHATVNANLITAPDGTTTGENIREDSANSSHSVLQSYTFTKNQVYTVSIYAKAGVRNRLTFEIYDGVTGVFCLYDLSAVTTSPSQSAAGVVLGSSITSVGNGWYRCSLSFQLDPASGATTTTPFEILLGDATGVVYFGAGSFVDAIYLWGAQLETGGSANSYIRTFGSPVTSSSSLVFNWTAGVSGCTYTVYYSNSNEPINFNGNLSGPAAITTGLNVTTASLGSAVSYAAVDHTSDYNTLKSAFDAAVATANAGFSTGESAFAGAFATLTSSITAAIKTYSNAIAIDLDEYVQAFVRSTSSVTNVVTAITGLGYSTGDFQDALTRSYGNFLQYLGSLLVSQPGLYTMPNGALGGAARGSASLGTGANIDGSSALSAPSIGLSLWQAAQPFVRNGKIRAVVRATKAGIQETGDAETIAEFDSYGAIILARPNKANVESTTITGGRTLSVVASVIEEEAAIAATDLQLFVVGVASSFNFSSAQGTVSLPTAYANYHRATVSYTAGSNGWFKYCVLAKNSTNSTQSASYETYYIYIDNTTPGAATNLSAQVIRGKGIRASES